MKINLLLASLLSIFLLLGFPGESFAMSHLKKTYPSRVVLPSPSPSPTSSPVNSYELFWPLVAGKTEGDPLYLLKTLKEKVREFFIFGTAQKADYQSFLGIKRILEAEELIRQGKHNLALKTLEEASLKFEEATQNINKAKKETANLGLVAVKMKDKLERTRGFVSWLAVREKGDLKQKFEKIEKQVTSLLLEVD